MEVTIAPAQIRPRADAASTGMSKSQRACVTGRGWHCSGRIDYAERGAG